MRLDHTSLSGQRIKTGPHANQNPCSVTPITIWGGGKSEEETPVPIPNTVVKLLCADGTAREAAWESRASPPQSFFNPPSLQFPLRSIPLPRGPAHPHAAHPQAFGKRPANPTFRADPWAFKYARRLCPRGAFALPPGFAVFSNRPRAAGVNSTRPSQVGGSSFSRFGVKTPSAREIIGLRR